MSNAITVLGIESSCDDTAASVVQGRPENASILSSVVFGQNDLHMDFGGVVPEIAARAHAEKVDIAVAQALSQAELHISGIDAVAVTAGPGLIGGVVSGLMCAKGICAASGLPLIGVNHLAGHALTPQMTDNLRFPYLVLLVSGGHCQFLLVRGYDDYSRLGGTIDDAPGEAFDKVARILGLPQPGGPAVEMAARDGDPNRFDLPRPLLTRPDCNMSFSGLKTALLRVRDRLSDEQGGLTEQNRSDLCASFQAAVTDVLIEKSQRALGISRELAPDLTGIAVAGGVAANRTIRSALSGLCAVIETAFVAPPLSLCTDNAAMIAFAGLHRAAAGQFDDMTLSARPRWPLDDESPALLGSGRKGAKA